VSGDNSWLLPKGWEHGDQSRWTIQHILFKNGEILAAVITVEGVWMDVVQRKLTVPPESAQQVVEHMPHAEQFEWIIAP